MPSPRRLNVLTTILLLFTAFSSAFPWPKFLPDLDSLIVRQNNNENTSSAKQTTGSSSPSATGSASTATVVSTTATGSGSSSGSGSGTITKAPTSTGKSGSASNNTRTAKTSYDPKLGVGVLSLATPALSSGAQYYKIGNTVTFAWNFTSLLASPTALNIMASCSVNNQLYTIAENQSIATTSVLWDTGAYQQTAAVPFPVASYTLYIYDAESSISAAAQPGYLAVYNQYQFGMYTKQAYTPIGQFVCATCSGALSSTERHALGFMAGMAAITVLSFTWFIGGLNVVW